MVSCLWNVDATFCLCYEREKPHVTHHHYHLLDTVPLKRALIRDTVLPRCALIRDTVLPRCALIRDNVLLRCALIRDDTHADPRVLESLFCGDPRGRVRVQQLADEVLGLCCDCVPFRGWELHEDRGVRQIAIELMTEFQEDPTSYGVLGGHNCHKCECASLSMEQGSVFL